VSKMTEQGGTLLLPDGTRGSGNGTVDMLRRGLRGLGRQREATILIVTVALLLYFGLTNPTTFVSRTNFVILFSENAASIAIIAVGEVLLLICGEIDLSVGFIYTMAPFIMFYLNVYYGVPALLAIILSLVFGLLCGFINGFLTVTLHLPSFITTLGTGFILAGGALYLAHAEPKSIPPATTGYGDWLGTSPWSQTIWAVVIVAVFSVVLTRTRWGLHTIATGGNQLGAREAGINVARIKYGNFMITGVLGALVGIQVAFYENTIDPLAGGYQPMFYSVTAAVIGGTAMLGGSGTIIGAGIGAIALSTLIDGFDVVGISANIVQVIFGAAILGAMIANVQLTRLRERGTT
jgi:simple sugar transport system permease protein